MELRSLSPVSCDSRGAKRARHEADTDTQAREHVDEGIGTEQVNPTPEKVTHPRLGHAHDLPLQPAEPRLDRFLNVNHQVRGSQMLSSSSGKVTE
jgi:hypothetical protein